MIQTKLTQYLFRVILILLFVPMLQQSFKMVKIWGLGGYHPKKTAKKLTQKNWLTGAYQKNKELLLKDDFGFRNRLIRAEHQWAFSAYGMPRVSGTVIGKNNYLYQQMYIDTKIGKDYLGEQKLDKLAYKLQKVQDTIRALNKAFVFITAPSKADFFPEYIPDKFVSEGTPPPTNYKVFKQKLDKYGIKHIDMNAWFMAMKDSSRYPLFPRTGIHYSSYGIAIAARRIIEEIEQQLQKDLPELAFEKIDWSTEQKNEDYDLEKALNLIYPLSNDSLAFPKIKFKRAKKYQPKSIALGDSFYLYLSRLGLADKVFRDGQVWYYLRKVFPGSKTFETLDFDKEFAQTEVIIVMLTPPNMKKFLGPFVEHLYSFYFDKNNFVEKINANTPAIKQQIAEIRKNPKWMASIKEKAKNRKIPIDRMLFLDAKYIVKKQKQKQKQKKGK